MHTIVKREYRRTAVALNCHKTQLAARYGHDHFSQWPIRVDTHNKSGFC